MEGSDRFHDECAVIGAWGHQEAAKLCYLGLYAMQHRGQEGAGIVSWDGDHHHGFKDMGLVADVFDETVLSQLQGSVAVGHTRYATCGSKDFQNLQPFVANLLQDSFAVAHNGNLVNALELRRSLEGEGAIFSSSSDTEVFLHLVARHAREKSFLERLQSALTEVRGAYSLVIHSGDSLFGVRDPHGVRPLSIGRFENGYLLASESVAFDLVGAQFLRDVQPGEIVEITADGTLRSIYFSENSGSLTDPSLQERPKGAFCVFEYVYFARPDSNVQGKNVYSVRKRLGAELAREFPAEADLVIPVPDSGVPAALGYAQELNLPFEFGLIRNHYIGRTFIEPQQSIRDFGVKVKLNPSSEILAGKRVVVVDDSIVRGTTCKKIVKMLRLAGAAEVHFRISSPPTMGPCYYGVDTPTKGELIANKMTHEEICSYIDADSLGYLSLDGMYRAVGQSREHYCDACFSLDYRLGEMPEPSQSDKLIPLHRKGNRPAVNNASKSG